ncbi:MAG: sigma-54 dependent transcriptional regulator [Nitrospinae bacterium]|nr:sigma-54 dependent transcriptional regulator [Nitrospinota bacterium]
MRENIIFLDPDKTLTSRTVETLKSCGIEVLVLEDAESALQKISPQWNGILVIPFDMRSMGGLEFLERVKNIDADLPVLMIMGQGDIQQIVSAMRLGAYDILENPLRDEEFHKIIRCALEKRNLVLQNRDLRSEISIREKSGSFIIGKSGAMERLCETIRGIAEVDADVLLVGETGTGKELVARCLHEQSPRGKNNYVAINCCAIPQEILESELFGHEPGAFTGANRRRIGKFEYAEGGTLYLDEIDSMPLHLQGKLLRVLQERTVERLGSNQHIPIDIRIIASTKLDLKKASEEGIFREDLYYRLNVIRIPLPSLRDHREDIPLLFQYFVHQACAKFQRPTPLITSEILQDILRQDWPGNVRELKNAAERFTLGYDQDSVDQECPSRVFSAKEKTNGYKQTLVEQMNTFEKTLIVQELARTSGDVKETYLTLGLPRKTLYDKMKKYALKRKDFLEPAPNGNME